MNMSARFESVWINGAVSDTSHTQERVMLVELSAPAVSLWGHST